MGVALALDCVGLDEWRFKPGIIVLGKKCFDFSAGGHGGLRAAAGDGDGGGGGGESRRGPWGRVPSSKRDGKCAVEAVARADGVDGLRLEGLDPGGEARAVATYAPSAPRLRTTPFRPLARSSLCGGLGAGVVADVESGFGFVGREPCELRRRCRREAARREQDRASRERRLQRRGQGVADGVHGQFKLAEDHAGGANEGGLAIDGGGDRLCRWRREQRRSHFRRCRPERWARRPKGRITRTTASVPTPALGKVVEQSLAEDVVPRPRPPSAPGSPAVPRRRPGWRPCRRGWCQSRCR